MCVPARADALSAGPVQAGASPLSLVNISNRDFAGVGDNIMIPGFVVSSEWSLALFVRGVGPGLTGFGVAGVLADPVLTVFSDPTAILTDDDWGNNPAAAMTVTVAAQVGAFPLSAGSKDAAFVVTLQPGVYTVQVCGSVSATGIALVEIHLVP